jgi:hypothetical protein
MRPEKGKGVASWIFQSAQRNEHLFSTNRRPRNTERAFERELNQMHIDYEIWREPSQEGADHAAVDGLRAARVVSQAFGLREPSEIARNQAGTHVVVRLDVPGLAYSPVFDVAWQIELEAYDLKTARRSP